MALDSAAKRQAVTGVGRPWMRGQMRDASVGASARASIGNAYPVAIFSAVTNPWTDVNAASDTWTDTTGASDTWTDVTGASDTWTDTPGA